MSLSGSIGTSEAKLPGQAPNAGQGPDPTPENPGGVFPASDPNPAPPSTIPGTGGSEQPVSDVGNPFHLRSILSGVDHAFSKAIADIEGEQSQVASSGETDPVVQRLKGWQKELADMMQVGGATGMNGTGGVSGVGGMKGRETAGSGGPLAQEGGLYTD